MRFPTLVLPATAPTRSSANGRTRAPRVSGSKTVSASTAATSSCLVAAIAVLRASAFPRFGSRITLTRGNPISSTSSPVPSVDPSSTTTTSNSG